MILSAIRAVVRNWRAYAASVGILALGIGMSVAMFSLVDAVLLRPLPFPGQDAIQLIWKVDPLAGNHVEELAYPELGDLQGAIPEFESVAVMPTSLYGYAKVLQTGNGEPVQIEGSPVSHDFFRVLGVAPRLGRDFAAADERVGAAPVAIVSDAVWRDQLGADPGIVGRMIRLNGVGYTLIGVMAAGVEFPRGAGLWVPLGVEKGIVERRGATFLQAIARLRPGTRREQVAQKVDALFMRLAVDHPEAYTRSQRGVVTPLVEYWAGSARGHLWIMLSAALLLLVAAVMSASNLVLSRMLSRGSEIAMRMALGARREDILAHLAAEGAVVAGAAAVMGLAIAAAAIRVLVRWSPEDIPRLPEASLNVNAFCFAAGAAALAAIACSLIPAWPAMRIDIETTLREGGARTSLSRRAGRSRNIFVMAQAAVTVMLLTVALLLTMSYRAMMAADTGFAHRDALSMNVRVTGHGRETRALYGEFVKRLREAPGVTAAAVLLRPLEGTIGWDVPYEFEFEAGARDNRVLPKGNYEVVTPWYFKTVGTEILEGRDFDEHDSAEGEPVAIVSRALAERIREAGHAPVGYRMRLGLGAPRWLKIVGVTADARYRNITQKGVDLFVPYLQAAPSTNYLVIRGTAPPQELAGVVRKTLNEIDPNQAVAGIATIGELIDRNAARHRFNMILLLWFGICAAILAATGVYSVLAESMAARRREIAIRTALGAQKPRLVRQMIASPLVFVVMGELAGGGLVWAFGRVGSELLYGVSARDPLVLGGVAISLFVVSAVAALWPAWSAAGNDPAAALRAS
jgi:putative ABC transport system permease protein